MSLFEWESIPPGTLVVSLEVMATAFDDRVVLQFPSPLRMTSGQFFDFCQANPELRLEQTSRGEVVIVPTGWKSGNRGAKVVAQLMNWAEADGSGEASGSDAGFVLPNGATRAPDASWIRRERLQSIPPEELERFLPLCPDFVGEVRSLTYRLANQQEKMREYLENGMRFGWLLDPVERTVSVYRPGCETEVLRGAASVSAAPELPGFILNLAAVWA